MNVAVVVPVLNEAGTLPFLLDSLRTQTRPPVRVVVVDGGSLDDTARLAGKGGAQTLVLRGRGRGGQIAAGVAICSEDTIVVGHADMRFPVDALAAISDHLARHVTSPGGCLGHRFDHANWVYRAIDWWDRRRARRGHSYGDQAQFFRRAALDEVGGFPDLPLMEDVELARRLRLLGRPAYLDKPVTVSARRYMRHGWPWVMWMNWRLRQTYRREGLPACWRLYRRYYNE
jgi:glycosyltransferase involved in cell wall biosynthesis